MTNQFSDQCTGAVVNCQFGGDLEGWYFNKILRALVGGEQRFYLAAHAFVIVASFIKKCGPLFGCAFEGRLEKIDDLFPALSFHRSYSTRCDMFQSQFLEARIVPERIEHRIEPD